MPIKSLQGVLTPVARRLAGAPWFARIGPKVTSWSNGPDDAAIDGA